MPSDSIDVIICHNVFEYNLADALKLFENENAESVNFGTIDEYDDCDLETFSKDRVVIDKVFGLRTFYALQRNELKTNEEWLDNMYEIECKAELVPEFRDIAFFHHVILKHR